MLAYTAYLTTLSKSLSYSNSSSEDSLSLSSTSELQGLTLGDGRFLVSPHRFSRDSFFDGIALLPSRFFHLTRVFNFPQVILKDRFSFSTYGSSALQLSGYVNPSSYFRPMQYHYLFLLCCPESLHL